MAKKIGICTHPGCNRVARYYVTVGGFGLLCDEHADARNAKQRAASAIRRGIVSAAPQCSAPEPAPVVKPKLYHLSPAAEELFLRMFAQVAPYEDKHIGPIYELAINLFYHVYGKVPADVPRFEELRQQVASGVKVPLFD